MRRPTLLVFAAFAAVAAAQQPKHLLTAETLAHLVRVGEVALSPDGTQVLYSARTTDLAADRSSAQIHLLRLGDGSDRVVTDAGSNHAPMWSADGKSFAFVSNRSGAAQIWVQPLDGAARQVSDHAGGVANVQWSPDGSHFLFTADVKVDADLHDKYPDLPKANARAYDDLMVRHWDTWNDGTYSHLFVVDAKGGVARDLLAGMQVDTPLKPFGGGEQIMWSPEGSEICYTAKVVPNPEQSTDSSLYVIPVEGGEPRDITSGMPGYDQEPAYSPDGRWIAFCSMARGGFEADRLRLFLHDRQSGANKELLPDFDASVQGLCWAPDSSAIYATVETLGTTQIYRATLDGVVAPVTAGRHAMSGIQVAADGHTLYALRTCMERPAEVVRITLGKVDGGVVLTHQNDAIYADLQLPTVEPEWFPASDGKSIHSWIVKPPGFDPAKKYPFLLYCQGGPQSMVGQGFSFRWNFHLMAANGYVIAGVNRRGLPGFGQAWNDQISRDWGGQCMQDLLSVCDAVQSRPYIDRAHCGAIGASFGGYTVYWLMGHAGDRFACMISHCGVFDLRSMYLGTEELWFPDWDLGGPFWKSAQVAKDYERFSPSSYVKDWKTPLMIIEGERDFRIPYSQGLQAFTAAQLMGVPSRLLEFPEESHWVLRAQNSVLWQREFYGWLDRWCKPAAVDATKEKR